MPFLISLAQLNFAVGDLEGNARKIIDAARQVHAVGVRLMLTPELALSGCVAEDLYRRPDFLAACEQALATVTKASAQWPGLTVVVGHPRRVKDGRAHNAASVLRDGRALCVCAMRELPENDFFDGRRYFAPFDQANGVFEVDGVLCGLLIGADAARPGPALRAARAGAQLLLAMHATPYHLGSAAEHEECLRRRVRETGLPLACAQLVGGQDEVVFDGRSFALDAEGAVALRASGFQETNALALITQGETVRIKAEVTPLHDAWEADMWRALVLGVRDYVDKNGFPGALLGLSGGIDSALVLALAVDALGADRVRTVMMPSPYTAEISRIDAREMAARLGVRHDEIAIAPLFDAFRATLAPHFAGRPEDTTEENLQARIRGTLLMALSNKFGAVVLTTGNKSETATGYCTLYGDTAGGFAAIKDLLKTRVFALARWRNANDPFGAGANPIPERIITRPPSAELREGQKDQDSLPPYETLDAIIERMMENDESVETIVRAGFVRADVDRVARLLRVSEYKRRQAPVGVRVTRRGFGGDWRYPLTNRFGA